MENSYFIFSEKEINIERFHICNWQFNDNSSLIEFGCEVNAKDLKGLNILTLELYLPWLQEGSIVSDFYPKLKDSANSRFIFNDSIISTLSLDGGQNLSGVIHEFSGRNILCILKVDLQPNFKRNLLTINVDCTDYIKSASPANIYFRFSIKPKLQFISTRKNGIGKSTIIYDIKVNEKRNLPDTLIPDLKIKSYCKISSCFCFNIIPTNYDLTFLEGESLKNVRTLEYKSFNKYLNDKRVKKDELLVIFNKKEKLDSYSFFSIYTQERIGAGQFALAVLINILCGILLFIPSYRKSFNPELTLASVWPNLPLEIGIAFTLIFLMIIYFMGPSISSKFSYLKSKVFS